MMEGNEEPVRENIDTLESRIEKNSLLTMTQLEKKITAIFQQSNFHSTSCSYIKRAGNIMFVGLIPASTVPFFLKAGVSIESSSLIVKAIAPICIVAMNLMQSGYAANEIWNYLGKMYQGDEARLKKGLKGSLALLLAIWPVIPYATTAYQLGENIPEKILLATTISLSGITFYYFTSYRFLDEGIFPTYYSMQNLCYKGKYKWHATLELKQLLKTILGTASFRIKNDKFMNEEFDSVEDIYEKFIKILEHGIDNTKSQTHNNRSRQVYNWVSKALGAASGLWVASGFMGYECAVKTFLEPFLGELSAWIFSAGIITSIMYLATSLGYHSSQLLLNTLYNLLTSKPVNLPFSLRNYPISTIGLGLIMSFIAAFSWADSVVSMQLTCPDSIKELFKNIIYFNSSSFNLLLALEFVNKSIMKFAAYKGSATNKNTLNALATIESLTSAIDNTPNEIFAKTLGSDKAKPLTDFFKKTCYGEEFSQLTLASSQELKEEEGDKFDTLSLLSLT